MKIAIYGKSFNQSFLPSFRQIISILQDRKTQLLMHQEFYEFLAHNFDLKLRNIDFFDTYEQVDDDIDFMFSIGGDGTFLETISFVLKKDIPIVGINSGRLGFLADIAQNEITDCMNALFNHKIYYENRALLEVNTKGNLFGDLNYALNEVTVQKKDTSSMITIHAYLNDKLINTYWADGLIVATPTGSTAYSLSVGGPIVAPNSENFIITPLAPHNLTVRPIVVADNNAITLKVQSRSQNFLTAIDYRSYVIDSSAEIYIKKSDHSIKLVKLENRDFYSTLRNKLMWGVDKRN